MVYIDLKGLVSMVALLGGGRTWRRPQGLVVQVCHYKEIRWHVQSLDGLLSEFKASLG